MENLIPKPLRIVKSEQPVRKREYTGLSALSCPQIPRRRSSLRGDWRQRSDESTNSIFTPPLSVSMEHLEVPKIRRRLGRRNGGLRRETEITSHTGDEYEEDVCSAEEQGECQVNGGRKSVLRLLSALGIQSWDSLLTRFLIGSSGNHGDRKLINEPGMHHQNGQATNELHSDTSLTSLSRTSTCHKQTNPIAPRSMPITGVKMSITAINSAIGIEPMSLWATAELSADVGGDGPVNSRWLVPLDVMIILDSVPQAAIGRLRQTVIGTLAVVSNLLNGVDHLAIAFIDRSAVNDFRILLRLGRQTRDSARTAIESFALHQLTTEKVEGADLKKVFRQLSAMLCSSERTAMRHIFFITATPPVSFTMPKIEQGIGFHTMSPDCCFPFDHPAVPMGWHIFYDIRHNDSESLESVLKSKVDKVIEHLRTGLDPGAVTDLKLSFIAGEGCQVQSVLEDGEFTILRPGEKWTIWVQVGVPAASLKREMRTVNKPIPCESLPIMDGLMVQLQEVLRDYSHHDIMQHVMTARLEYQHSLLPPHTTVCLESQCTVTRDAHEVDVASWNFLGESVFGPISRAGS
ncbi:hypothetical protein PHISCL_07564 [Aspergillus sclerotialis]|uniref:Uncharacterized protein n=1 Tax=Aspergillus sclerotialis TaxID=2070753 RepID=A0A3A2ZAF5_9EURO|nr:hypothetical protein PHISCL_07564 [Aspergillus sclerotialis]